VISRKQRILIFIFFKPKKQTMDIRSPVDCLGITSNNWGETDGRGELASWKMNRVKDAGLDVLIIDFLSL
jgi:hypothetical protein